MCLCSPSSITWYLARAFMLMCCNVAAGIGSNEQGEYCRAAQQRSDRKEPRYKWPSLLYFYFNTLTTRNVCSRLSHTQGHRAVWPILHHSCTALRLSTPATADCVLAEYRPVELLWSQSVARVLINCCCKRHCFVSGLVCRESWN